MTVPAPAPPRRTERRPSSTPRPPLSLIAVAAVVLLASLVPLVFVAVAALRTPPELLAQVLGTQRVAELLLNTGALLLFALPIIGVLGVGLAWLTERTRLPGRRVWRVLLAAPLAIPAFVNAYAWVSVVPSIGGVWGGTLVSVLSYYPLVMIPVAATLATLDGSFTDTAASLGHGPWRRFFSTVLPLIRLPLAGGLLLVALHLLSEYGAFAMMRFDTFTTAIMGQYQSTFASEAATTMAGVLVLACLLILALDGRLRRRTALARVGSGSARTAEPVRLGGWLTAALALPAGTVFLAVGVPIGVLVGWLISGGAAVWTPEVVEALLQTLGLAVLGAAVTVTAGWPVAHLVVRHPGFWSRLAERIAYIASAVPSIVVGLAFVVAALDLVPPLYQTVANLVVAYLVLLLPRVLVTLRAGLAQIPAVHEEVARTLGRRPLAAFWSTTARMARPATGAGFALVFLGVVNELTLTLLLAPTGTRTLAMAFWSASSEIDYRGAAPFALCMIVLSAPMTWLLHRLSPAAATGAGAS
ncbi:ABC transporter permease [Enemella evansiae]|uniref:ABC transporter permease n=1 Tax=Enemella evansiae TaxID=2016499 RepID=UPI001E5DC21C|nr:iron ABC transporter permease [Enemella evansiae]